jgi:hypothetical protein
MTDLPLAAAYAPGLSSGPAGPPDEILAIPAHVVTMLVILGMETIVMFITWLIVLVAGRMPRALYKAIAAGLRYYIRFTGYLFLVTATYPWGLFGDEASAPAEGTGWLGGSQPWRLVLSSGAKGLVGMFLAIGVLVAALYGVLIGVATSSSSNTASPAAATVRPDANQVARDYRRLATAAPASQYHQIVASTGLNQQELRFAAAVGGLDRMLGVV